MNAELKSRLAFIFVETHASECKTVKDLYEMYKQTVEELEQIQNESPKKRQTISY